MKTISLSKSKIDKEIFKIRRSQQEDFTEIEDLVSKIISKVKKIMGCVLFLAVIVWWSLLANLNFALIN